MANVRVKCAGRQQNPLEVKHLTLSEATQFSVSSEDLHALILFKISALYKSFTYFLTYFFKFSVKSFV